MRGSTRIYFPRAAQLIMGKEKLFCTKCISPLPGAVVRTDGGIPLPRALNPRTKVIFKKFIQVQTQLRRALFFALFRKFEVFFQRNFPHFLEHSKFRPPDRDNHVAKEK